MPSDSSIDDCGTRGASSGPPTSSLSSRNANASVPSGNVAGGDRQQRIGKLEEERAQPRVTPAVGFRRVVRERNGDARGAIELTEIVDRFTGREPLRRSEVGHDRRLGGASDEQPFAPERKRERACGQRFGPDMSRCESHRRVHGTRSRPSRAGAARRVLDGGGLASRAPRADRPQQRIEIVRSGQ